ncbi:uncharacterized protein AMSG_11072 [Thecamonas trahens ATCC 50062]|uniref:Uncharacterized protein n=1 Tax=Thecamonas trahens ATCC 50062 TaxID=461836 RepID=A0A0L0DTM4_THETB|nr:hypothetical protein AMSG_11072 [Thecamonas trahens ATCC 50062]KNC55411.1 hypothetical protein AMSG_11072 [Thecamonas trahens ATCC 50062]|eukprot:XP_013752950.1 hypothetical protein AMSG_11072 [Thecamonas trahens ATCC 50062]
MSFMGFFGGMDLDKPFYKSRMFIGGTVACIALLGVEYYMDNYGPKRLTPSERARVEEEEWAEEEARLERLKARDPNLRNYLNQMSSSSPEATATRPTQSILKGDVAPIQVQAESTEPQAASGASTS